MTPTTPRPRPKVTQGTTERVRTGCGSLFITINHDDHGICEVFGTLGKTGGCASAQMEALCRMLSQCLRSDIDLTYLVSQLKGIRCPSMLHDGELEILSCADAIASVLEKHISRGEQS